jgi:hypothetical protein
MRKILAAIHWPTASAGAGAQVLDVATALVQEPCGCQQPSSETTASHAVASNRPK